MACDDAAEPPISEAGPPAVAPVAEPAAVVLTPPGFDAALARGIVSPSVDDGTYRVDPFVATLVYERLRTDTTPLAWVEADGPAPAGYQVGPVEESDVLFKLGLRSGDIVEALNGVSLQTAEQRELAIDAAENRLTVMIFREDLSFTNSYRFDGGLAWRDVIGGAEEPAPRDEPSVAEAGVEPGDAAAPIEAAHDGPTSSSKKTRRVTRPAAKPKRPNTKPPAPRSSEIRCSSGSACTITKRKFDDLRSSPSRMQKGVDIVPAIRNDVFSGYKLKRVNAGSSVHQLGFRSGDKITHINGRDLTDDTQAMALYWSLGSSKVFKIRYERGGRKQVKTVRVV